MVELDENDNQFISFRISSMGGAWLVSLFLSFVA
jgi:hypothetical protein